MPVYERDDEDTQDGRNRKRTSQTPFIHFETAKFPIERRLRVSAKILSPYRDFSPASAIPAQHPLCENINIIAKISAANLPRKNQTGAILNR